MNNVLCGSRLAFDACRFGLPENVDKNGAHHCGCERPCEEYRDVAEINHRREGIKPDKHFERKVISWKEASHD